MIHIKICGITRIEDAQAAIAAGADAIGFVLWPGSPRAIELQSVASIVDSIDSTVETVGVFVAEDPGVVMTTLRQTGLSTAQLHGDEGPEYLANLHAAGFSAYPAFRCGPDTEDTVRCQAPRRFLLDAYHPDLPGGTGQTADHTLARRLTGIGELHLAGGLTPENVAAALDAVQPVGVDASSALEIRPGIKDHQRIHDFIDEVRSWERRMTAATSGPTAGNSSPKH